MKFILVEIFTPTNENDWKGQETPARVTVKVEDGSIEEALESSFINPLCPFNVQPSARYKLPCHFEFLTFSFDDDIREHFGVPRIEPKWGKDFERLFKKACAMTVGDLKALIAELPDDLPLIHTPRSLPGEHLGNRQGLHVSTGKWKFTGPGIQEWSHNEQWCVRIGEIDRGDWEKVLNGTWRDITAADIMR